MSIPIPTIGRIVLFRGSDGEDRPAIVTHVWSEFCVNLYVFPKNSSDTNTGPRTSITHIGPETNEQPTTGPSWRWMPFQIQTAGTRHQDVPKNTMPLEPMHPTPVRTITDHILNQCNDKLVITTTDWRGSGGANHRYEITGFNDHNNTSRADENDANSTLTIVFQNGPINEMGVNGITQEALLAIVIDRLRSFQAGPYACTANAHALQHAEEALHWLQQRTLERMRRGVEGTHTV